MLRHARARAKEEIYSHKGMVAIMGYVADLYCRRHAQLVVVKNGAHGVLVEFWFNRCSESHLIVVKSEIVHSRSLNFA